MSGRLPSVRAHHFTHPDNPNVITVAMHAKDLKEGTLSGILADAGIDRHEFLRLLK